MVDLSIHLPKGFLDEEPRTLIVSRRRKEVWAVELDLLVQLDRVCKKHGIRYFCDGGTVLGAVRHGGFIPWDDDIDVIMSRTEYEKLNAVAPAEFRHPYFWQTNETDPGSARGHAQLRNSDTTAILKMEMHRGLPLFRFNQGIFVDVFPFDNLPDGEEERKRFRTVLRKCRARINAIRRNRIAAERLREGIPDISTLFHAIQAAVTRIGEQVLGRDALSHAVSELERQARRYDGIETREVAPLTLDPDHREVLPTCFLREAEEVNFEFLKIPVLSRHLESIEINYGKNWREHVVGAARHGGFLIDTDRPYTDYFPGGLRSSQ